MISPRLRVLVVTAAVSLGLTGLSACASDEPDQQKAEPAKSSKSAERKHERQKAKARAAKRRERVRRERRRQRQETVTPPPPPSPPKPAPTAECDPNYDPCVPPYPPDLDCPDISGPVTVKGSDPHGLDADSDGSACE